MNKKLSAIAVLACIAISAGIVSAQQLGAFNQTNVVNSNPTDNIDLSNSTLNLNVNGENLTISNQQTPDDPTATPDATPTATPPLPWITVTEINISNDGSTLTPNEYSFQATINDPCYNVDMVSLAQNITSIVQSNWYTQYGLEPNQVTITDNANGAFTMTFIGSNTTATFANVSGCTGAMMAEEDLAFYFNHCGFGQ